MDPNMAAMQNLPAEQQQQLMQAIEQMQVRDRCARRPTGRRGRPCWLLPVEVLLYHRCCSAPCPPPRWLGRCRRRGCCCRALAAVALWCAGPPRRHAAPPVPLLPLCTCRSLRMYNSLVERCFRDCVTEFRSKDLNAAEEKVGGTGIAVGVPLPTGSLLTCMLAGGAAGVGWRGWGAEAVPQARWCRPAPTSRPPLPAPPAPPARPSPQCVQSCATKFMKHSARVGIRFGELSSEAESQMQAMMQQQQAGK